MATPGPLRGRLDALRRSQFVGRADELAFFDALLDDDSPPVAVTHVHGPGGTGKSTLSREFQSRAESAGAVCVRIDGHTAPPSPDGIKAGIVDALGLQWGDEITAGDQRLALFLDTYELLEDADDWIRDELVPSLPADAITVITGRNRPTAGWRSDPVWRDLQRPIELRNLPHPDATAFLTNHGIEPGPAARIAELTHGHPLALALVLETVSHGGDVDANLLTPDIVGTLVRQFADQVPSPSHRRALEVLAVMRVTTEGSLAAAPGIDDPVAAFAWLRALSFVEAGPEGLTPHDLARDVLEADFRWRDADGYRDVLRAITENSMLRLVTEQGTAKVRALQDSQWLWRHVDEIDERFDWTSLGTTEAVPSRPEHLADLLTIVETQYGPESRAAAEHWWQLQPGAFWSTVDRAGDVRGLVALLDLAESTPEQRAADPVVEAIWNHLQAIAPAGPNERFLMIRFVIDRDTPFAIDNERGTRPSAATNHAASLGMVQALLTPNPGWGVTTGPGREYWRPYADFMNYPMHDFNVTMDGIDHFIMGNDFRQLSAIQWLEDLFNRSVDRNLGIVSSAQPRRIALAHDEFAAACRQALRELHRPAKLAGNPLLLSRLVGTTDEPAGALVERITEAIDQLKDHPRDEKLFAALNRTYLHPAPTQEKAAEILDLPFSTYRRHLATGIDRVIESLWQSETHA